MRSVARFRLRVHTLKVEQATWNDDIPPTCDLYHAQDDVEDEQHALFKCTHNQVCSLRLKCASLFSGPLLSLSSASSQAKAANLPSTHQGLIGRNHVCMHAAANFGTSSKPRLGTGKGDTLAQKSRESSTTKLQGRKS
eukprot:1152314-Pelagomonas_calceolata.AAC.1